MDDNGYIVGQQNISHPDENVDIIFFGGSTTECMFVDEKFRFPHYTSILLSNELKKNIITLNAGVSGNHSLHSLISLIAKGIEKKPKFAVLMNAGNDAGMISKTLSYWKAPITRKIIQERELGINQNNQLTLKESFFKTLFLLSKFMKDFFLPNFWLFTRDSILKNFSNSKNNSIVRITDNVDEWSNFRHEKKDLENILNKFSNDFYSSLRSFVMISRVWDIEPILMTQFNRIKENDEIFRRIYEKNKQPIDFNDFIILYKLSNSLIRKVALEEKVTLIDLDKEIPKTSEFIYDSMHLNKSGSILVSQIISEVFLEKYNEILTN